MTTGRNDACPCGSGRKYKKCCLVKKSLADTNRLKVDQFFQLKYELTTKMLNFLRINLNQEEIREATRLFQSVQKQETSSKVIDSNNKFWLCYFYTLRNGYRGVEWFLKKGSRFSAAERDLLTKWVEMKPRLLQVTGEEATGITVTDLITKESFFLPYCESLQKGYPWGVAIAMLEPFGDAYCIHGISSFKHPSFADKLSHMVREQMEKTGKAYLDVMLDSYVELVEASLSDPAQPIQNRPSTTMKEETTLDYEVFDFDRAIQFVQEVDGGIAAEEWDEKQAKFTWTDSWYQYTDSSFPGRIQVTEEFASIILNKQELNFHTKHPDKAKKFISQAEQYPAVLKLKEKKSSSPLQEKEISTITIRTELKGTPPWLVLYAQQLTGLKRGVTNPLPQFGGQSRLSLAASGDTECLETWLREAEYHINLLVSQKYPDIKVPFNANPIRSELGLPPSPFVAKDHRCSLEAIEIEPLKIEVIAKDNMPYYEQIGLTENTAFDYYAKDLVEFFIEKSAGKSASTIKKYQWGVQKVVNYFLDLDQQPQSWDHCLPSFWEDFISRFYFLDSQDGNLSQAQSFLSVVKNLAQWLDKKHQTTHFIHVKKMVDEMEEDVLSCVRWLNAYRRSSVKSTTKTGESSNSYQVVSEEVYEILAVSPNGVELRPKDRDVSSFVCRVKTEYLKTGMILQASIGQKIDNSWELVDVKAIYPPHAKRFLYDSGRAEQKEALTI